MIRVEIYEDCGKGLEFKRPSLVKVQFADECDLTKIVQRFVKTGQLPNLDVKKPLSNQDVTDAPDSFEAFKQKQIEANNVFEQLPLELREVMQHSPEIFFEWLGLKDEDKIEFLKKQGCPHDFIKSLIKQPELSGIPAAGTPAAGTPAAGTPAAGTSVAGTPAAGTPAE